MILCGVDAALLLTADGRKQALAELGCKLGYMATNRPGEYINPPDKVAWDRPIMAARSILFAHDSRVWTQEKRVALDILLLATHELMKPPIAPHDRCAIGGFMQRFLLALVCALKICVVVPSS